MERYYDMDKLSEMIEAKADTMLTGKEIFHYIAKWLNLLPAADVEEVKHGYWRQNQYCKRVFYCSECNRHIEDATQIPQEHFPYCHCGAKMDGGKE